MKIDTRRYVTKLAQSDTELKAAQRLRYHVFVQEMGASTNDAGRKTGLEADAFDPYFDHLLLIDQNNEDPNTNVVGVYRLMMDDAAKQGIGFYSDSEYDLEKLVQSGRKSVELGRSCLHPDHRGGVGLSVMWDAVSDYVQEREIQILFGVASFHGTDVSEFKHALANLYHSHLAPAELRVKARERNQQSMDLMPKEEIDRRLAMQQTPSLIKAYLRLGGMVGLDAFIDYEFNTTDICMIVDTQRMTEKSKKQYQRRQS